MTLIEIVLTVAMKQTIRSRPTCRLVGSAVLPVGRPGDKFSHHVSITRALSVPPGRLNCASLRPLAFVNPQPFLPPQLPLPHTIKISFKQTPIFLL